MMATFSEEAIRLNIAKNDWQKLSEVMIGAEKVGVPRAQRLMEAVVMGVSRRE